MCQIFSKTNCWELPDHQRLVSTISNESLKLEKIKDEEKRKEKEAIIDFLLELQCITSTHIGDSF